MAWSENLQRASFRGVRFEVLDVTDSIGRAHATYEYPFIDGGDLKDLGRKPRRYKFTAFFWGDDYDARLQRFTTALDEPGPGELVHPVYGSIPHALAIEYEIKHVADNVDSCVVDLTFLEDRTGTTLFNQQLPEQLGAAIFDRLDELVEQVASFFDAIMAPINMVKSLLKRGRAIANTLLNTLFIFKSDILTSIDDFEGFLKYPSQFVREFQRLLEMDTSKTGSSIPALRNNTTSITIANQPLRPVSPGMNTAAPTDITATPTTVIPVWNSILESMDAVVTLPADLINGDVPATIPVPAQSAPDDVVDVTVLYAVQSVGELANAATAILSDDIQTAVLSPDDIETIVDSVRERMQSTIDRIRHQYEPAQETISSDTTPIGLLWQPVVAQLKNVALDLQNLGLTVIAKRPPLTKKTVISDSCLRLLAHQWYGDHSRAVELQRLNPQLRNPNKVNAGDVINAYTR
ncbi:multidrug DMT transporter permease [Limnobaculum zhutongyuii]|uniref:Multidrug DMT transporter permease n=1 Tax=Limnobaculum zhutongyuii TaxID=2498113 RepID=A0A411WII9_9GAMM|nr:DNA circularization N-terminal domain-containing protein [Limnobaculum zhutongyuii]QBH95997.1 multidrug DMT transporter permease [Limnobaculum zhutongyuii]TQS89292.1 multidrug DMT transporter permease [Limnobaculum zhutongyuii]